MNQTSADYSPVLTPDEIVELKASRSIDERALRSIFLEARTVNGFLARPVHRDILTRAVDLALLGPTSANGLPLRLVFVESQNAKERLRPALGALNVEKTMAAPVTAIVAADTRFFERFDRTFPERADMFKSMFGSMGPEAQHATAWDNAILQMAYLIIAVRAVGLDAGPMAGFDRAVVDEAFFPDGRFKTIYLVNIGYGDDTKLFPRLPRFNVDEIAQFT